MDGNPRTCVALSPGGPPGGSPSVAVVVGLGPGPGLHAVRAVRLLANATIPNVTVAVAPAPYTGDSAELRACSAPVDLEPWALAVVDCGGAVEGSDLVISVQSATGDGAVMAMTDVHLAAGLCEVTLDSTSVPAAAAAAGQP